MLVDIADPVGAALVVAVHTGDLVLLQELLREQPGLAAARIQRRGGSLTPLHVVTDWPGYFPEGPEIARILLAAGADPNARTEGKGKPETPLHWAASSDDVEVAEALIDGGANLETPDGSIGTPLDNAIGYGCWHVARLLFDRGARLDKLWHAAALGQSGRVAELLRGDPAPDQAEIDAAFWQACHGGQFRAARLLLGHGADIDFVPSYARGTPLDVALGPDTRRSQLVTWLREQGARSAETTD